MRLFAVFLSLLGLLSLSSPTAAWVSDTQPFPSGEAAVVLGFYCWTGSQLTDYCGSTTQSQWLALIREVVDEWNAVSNFRFHIRSVQAGDDPCQVPPGQLFVILMYGKKCPGDRFPSTLWGITVPTRSGARVYINSTILTYARPIQRFLLLHEFGHAVGLGHPNEAGQSVSAVMNGNRDNAWGWGFANVPYSLQPDDIAGAQALWGMSPDSNGLGVLENPRAGSGQSGISVISGWVCEAETVEIAINGVPYPVPYGAARLDTEEACGDVDNGFGLLFNWNLLGDGEHDVVAMVDGEMLDQVTIAVTTLGAEYPTGLEGEYVLEDFPQVGASVVVRWEESLQNFTIVEHAPQEGGPPGEEPDNSSADALEIEMVLIPAGTFQMGSPVSEPGHERYEGPRHQVTIRRPFYLGKYEVTQAQWTAVMGTNPSQFSNCDTCPVDSVSWDDTQAFLRELNRRVQGQPYRLPTEAEWEYAARAGTSTAYSFGAGEQQLGLYAWYADNAGGKTHPVGGKRPNAFGLYDVHGNVKEWVQDCWNETYSGAPTDGSVWLTGRCGVRVTRSSSWTYGPLSLRSAARSYELTSDRHDGNSGFRLARSVE